LVEIEEKVYFLRQNVKKKVKFQEKRQFLNNYFGF